MEVLTRDDVPFARYMKQTDPQAKMRPASAWRNLVKQRLRDGLQIRGTALPWGKTADKFRFREGEVTLLAGETGHGKSLVTGQIVLGMARANVKSCIASFEMAPTDTLERMTVQASGGPEPTDEFVDQFHDWTDGRIWLYDHRGRIDPEHMLAVCRYAYQEVGIKLLVIDSLMKVVRREDDYNEQKDFVDAICQVATDSVRDGKGMHILLLHHMRKDGKSSAPSRPGSRSDIRGSSLITDQVDNICVWWRNKPKEEDADGSLVVDQDETKPDAMWIVEKQRHFSWDGRFYLWFNKGSMQYVGAPNARPMEFL